MTDPTATSNESQRLRTSAPSALDARMAVLARIAKPFLVTQVSLTMTAWVIGCVYVFSQPPGGYGLEGVVLLGALGIAVAVPVVSCIALAAGVIAKQWLLANSGRAARPILSALLGGITPLAIYFSVVELCPYVVGSGRTWVENATFAGLSVFIAGWILLRHPKI